MSLQARKWAAATGLLWLLICAVASSNAGFDFRYMFVMLGFAGVWAVIWLARLGTHLWRDRRSASPRAFQARRSAAYWAFEPAVALLVLGLAWSGVFFQLRFSISEPALARYAEGVRTGQVDIAFEFAHEPRRVGLYFVSVTDLLPDGTVRFITSGAEVMNDAGFAHSASASPPVRGEDSYRHIRNQWWNWHQSW